MPFKLELTWISHARKWRKRYLNTTYYLKTKCGGKSDRQGYLAALREWERLKAFIDGLGPNPYTHTGALIPEGHYLAAAPAPEKLQSAGIAPQLVELGADPPFIVSRGIAAALHPGLIVNRSEPVLLPEERRVSATVTLYLDHRRKEAERGNLSLKQYDEDKRQVETFQNFLTVNYPTLAFIDQLSPAMLNLYRDKQTDLCTSNVTLKKRLEAVRKWLSWLIDRNILKELPKDLSNYAKVKLDKPRPEFFSVDELKTVYGKAGELVRACMLLGLNAGFTQRDCSSLIPSMIDWQTGILTRERSKTGTDQRAKLWPETIELLRKVGNVKGSGPILRNSIGNPLVYETVGENGKVTTTDTIKHLFRRFQADCENKSFKDFRKTSANYIEKWNASLTGLFLAHSESSVKKHYVARHFEELFVLTDKLRETYDLK